MKQMLLILFKNALKKRIDADVDNTCYIFAIVGYLYVEYAVPCLSDLANILICMFTAIFLFIFSGRK